MENPLIFGAPNAETAGRIWNSFWGTKCSICVQSLMAKPPPQHETENFVVFCRFVCHAWCWRCISDCGVLTAFIGRFWCCFQRLLEKETVCNCGSTSLGGASKVIFTARSSFASAVLEIVILSVRPSVRHTRALWRNERTYCRYFDTTWKGNHSSVLIPTEGGGRCPLSPKT